MKKLKYLSTIFAVTISLLLSFDDSFSSCFDKDLIPVQSDCSGVSHHHLTISDHFFYKNPVVSSSVCTASNLRLIMPVLTIADQYHCSIWQPPKQTC